MVSSDVYMMCVIDMYYRDVIFMYRIYLERNCIDGGFMNSLKRFKTVML